MRTIPGKTFVVAIFIVFSLGVTLSGNAAQQDMSSLGTKYDVRILRDTWGVPHIFGKKDPMRLSAWPMRIPKTTSRPARSF